LWLPMTPDLAPKPEEQSDTNRQRATAIDKCAGIAVTCRAVLLLVSGVAAPTFRWCSFLFKKTQHRHSAMVSLLYFEEACSRQSAGDPSRIERSYRRQLIGRSLSILRGRITDVI